jgi:hypothetical protein
MSPEAAVSKGVSATAVSPASSAAAGQRKRRPATIRYLDRVDVEETFADSINRLFFDGQTLRIEFGVTRFDDVRGSAPVAGRRYPSCRLVLSRAAAVDLINRMQRIGAALTQAGAVKAAPRPSEASKDERD